MYKRPQTLKLLQKAHSTLEDTCEGKDFLQRTPFVWDIRPTVDMWDLRKLESFHAAKKIDHQMKRNPTVWKRIFATVHLTKVYYSEFIERELKKPRIKKTNKFKNFLCICTYNSLRRNVN